VIVCAGRGGRPAFDDTLCAGYLAERIRVEAAAAGFATEYGDGARIACAVNAATATGTGRGSGGLRGLLAEGDAGRAVLAVKLGADLDWCAAIDATRVVPAAVGTTGSDASRDLLELRPAPDGAEEELPRVHP
jgi:phosphosulfolactate phosphohydrolase-like enzyme